MRETRPLLVFGSFRTGSTWFWSQLKLQRSVCAYYEVFHERLSLTNLEDISRFSPTSWPSGHSGSVRYFDEYASILGPNGGVIEYDKRMSFDWMIPNYSAKGGLRPQEKAYLELLVKTAWNRQKTPVLTFNRGMLRAKEIQQYLDAHVVLLIRNPLFQWISHLRQRQLGVDYFLRAAARVGQQMLGDHCLAALMKCYLPSRMTKQGAKITDLSVDEAWLAFAGIQIITRSLLMPIADLVVSIDDLSESSEYRFNTASALSELMKQDVKLDPASVTQELPLEVREQVLSKEERLRSSTLKFTTQFSIGQEQTEFVERQIDQILHCASSVLPSTSALDLPVLADIGNQAMVIRKSTRENVTRNFESALDHLEDELFPPSFKFWTE